MWVSRKWLNEFTEKVAKEIEKEFEQHKQDFHTKPQLYCETCGCLLQREMAVAGEPVIRKGQHRSMHVNVIHYPFFCKMHAPKKETQEEIKAVRV